MENALLAIIISFFATFCISIGQLRKSNSSFISTAVIVETVKNASGIVLLIFIIVFITLTFMNMFYFSSSQMNMEINQIIDTHSPIEYQDNSIYRNDKVIFFSQKDPSGKFEYNTEMGNRLPGELQGNFYDNSLSVFVITDYKEKFDGVYRSGSGRYNVYSQEARVWVIDWSSKQIIGTKYFSSKPPANFTVGGPVSSDIFVYPIDMDLAKWIKSLPTR